MALGRAARLAALVLTIGAVAPATAQLLPPPPGGSLIVTLTSPGQGSTVQGTIPVSASVSIVGSLTVSRVDFFADGNFIGFDSGAPYSISWDTRSVGNGSHTLTAVAQDMLGARWTSNAVSVTVANDITRPAVSINQAAGQADPASASPINFTVVFSEPVSGFTGANVTIGGSAGGTKTLAVTGGPSTYNVAVSGMTDGTVSATIGAGAAQDAAGNTNTASTSTDNTVTFAAPDTTRPTVTINQAAGQADPSSASPINFTVVFSEPVSGFTGTDVTIGGTAGGTKTVTVTGSGSTYNAAVSGVTTAGTVIATIAAGVATDVANNTNTASTSTDNTVTWTPPDTTAPTVTINQAAGQADPSSASPINFTVVFSEPVSGFTGTDVTIGGTAGGTKTVTVTGSGSTYTVAVSGMTTSGTVTATIAAGVATDVANNTNTASTSTDNTVTWTPPDTTAPTVTINQAADQADPTSTSPIQFTVVFSEPVSGFTDTDVTISGTAGGTKTVTVTGSGSTYTVAVSGMTTSGTVTASIPAAAAQDAAGNNNTASTSTDATVTFNLSDTTPPTVSLTSPANGATVSGTVTVAASASDNVGVSRVEFLLDAAVAATVTTTPYSVPWDTTKATDGSHTIAARAVDAAGNVTTSATFTVTVSNGTTADTTPPTVSVTSPTNGAKVSGTITVSASASDNVGVSRVEFLLDGTLATTVTTSPYSIPWDTTKATDGSHTIAARAVDTAGNVATSATITVTVANDTSAPTVTINQAAGQSDPASASPINFTVVFSEPVSGFTGTDVTIGGTAGGTKTVTVTGSGSTYNAAVSGVTTAGTVIATIAAGVATDAANNTNTASTSTDNTVTFETSAPPTGTRVEAEDNRAGFAGTGWRECGPEVAAFSAGIAGCSDLRGDTYTLTFTGTAVSWLGLKCSVCGIASVSIDGGPSVTVDTAGPGAPGSGLTSEVLFSASGLESAVSHTMVITVTGTTNSGGAFIVVDAFDLNGSTTGSVAARFEEASPAISASPTDAWVRSGPEVASFSGAAAGSSDVTEATITFTFTGTAVSWIGLRCSVCGIATVSIDGGAATAVDTAGPAAPGSPGLTSEAVFTASNLTAGSHTMVITVTGATTSGGAHIIVDAFDVTSGTASAVNRIEENNPAVSVTGAWVLRGAETAAFSGGSAGSSDEAGATATISFTGTAVSWIGLRCSACGIATVSIDGGAADSVDTVGSSAPGSPGLASEVVFTSSGLAPGSHTMVITVTGGTTSGGAHVVLDAVDVMP